MQQLLYQVYSCNVVIIDTQQDHNQTFQFHFGQNFRYLGSLIWNSIPTALRNVGSFVEFKSLIKNSKPSNCPSRLCKDYIPEVGFVNLTQQLTSNDKGIVIAFTLYYTAFKFCIVLFLIWCI